MKKRAKKIWESQNEKCIEVTCPNGHNESANENCGGKT